MNFKLLGLAGIFLPLVIIFLIIFFGSIINRIRFANVDTPDLEANDSASTFADTDTNTSIDTNTAKTCTCNACTIIHRPSTSEEQFDHPAYNCEVHGSPDRGIMMPMRAVIAPERVQ